MEHYPTLCRACTRLNKDGNTCEAYPKGIPAEIVQFGESHLAPRPGDNGLQFSMDPRRDDEYQQWVRFINA